MIAQFGSGLRRAADWLRTRMARDVLPPVLGPRDLQFVFVAEQGLLERQAVLLAESIRLLGDDWRDAELCAVSPRAARRPGPDSLQALERLGVRVVALDVESPCPDYGTSWRMAALTRIEAAPGPPVMVMLDSDTLFLAPPRLRLDPRGVALRPVDVKGICSEGPQDPLDRYWQRLAQLCDVDLDAVPWVDATVTGERIRASHNGGFVAVARHHGLFARAFQFLERTCLHDLAPRTEIGGPYRIGSGEASGEAIRLWGSAQTTLTMAMVSLGLHQQLLPPTYNVPLHLADPLLRRHPQARDRAVHVHYHHLCEADTLASNPLLDGRMQIPDPVRALLARHLPLDRAPA